MSNNLEQFKKNYADFAKYHIELLVNLSKSHRNLVFKFTNGSSDFTRSPWTTLDTKTLAEFKALAIYDKISKKILPIVFPNLNFERAALIPVSELLSPQKITPTQLTSAFDSIKKITEEARLESISNSTTFEVILNFLESCVNFLISCVTCGHENNFFKSNTFQLEQIENLQEDMHAIFNKLSDDEKVIGLDRPAVNSVNGFVML
jgi:hypothetical protein